MPQRYVFTSQGFIIDELQNVFITIRIKLGIFRNKLLAIVLLGDKKIKFREWFDQATRETVTEVQGLYAVTWRVIRIKSIV